MMILRYALSIAILPFAVTVIVPIWIGRRVDLEFGAAASIPTLLVQILGIVVMIVGASLFVASLRQFAVEGKGTLAPWDPPRRLVVQGPYRYVRNPMISGVVFVLIGEALLLRSEAHAIWAGIFLAANVIVITLYEEPHLEQVFGDAYLTYCTHVPRVIPRLSAWRPE